MQRSSGLEPVGAKSTTNLRLLSLVPVDAATANPEQARATLTVRRRTRHAAGCRAPRNQNECGEDAQAAPVLRNLIRECVETMWRAVHSRAAEDARRPIFDIAGRQTDGLMLLRPSREAMPPGFPRSADG